MNSTNFQTESLLYVALGTGTMRLGGMGKS